MKEKEWWEYLDWSTMNMTFQMMPKEKQKIILEKGYWSKGKGQFVVDEERGDVK